MPLSDTEAMPVRPANSKTDTRVRPDRRRLLTWQHRHHLGGLFDIERQLRHLADANAVEQDELPTRRPETEPSKITR